MAVTRTLSSAHGTRTGFTLLEMMLVLVLTSVVWLIFLNVTAGTITDLHFLLVRNDVDTWNQKIVNDIRDDVLSARFFFGDDARGNDYYDALAVDALSPPLASTRLPIIDDMGLIEPDDETFQKTGNILFLAKTLEPFVVTVSYTDVENRTYRINVYRFIAYYLTERSQEQIARHVGMLDLVRWASMPVAEYAQIMDIEDPDPADLIVPREEVVAAFAAAYQSTWLWDSGEQWVNNAFYACDDTGYIANAPDVLITIPQDATEGMRSLIPVRRTTAKRMTICYNDGTTNFEAAPAVPRYALPDATAPGFPHGFEVQIVGPSGARTLMFRVAAAKEFRNALVAREFTGILTTRDF